MVFLPRDEHGVVDARRIFEEECAACGIPLLFWRTVPVDPHDLGATAQACMSTIMQAFLGRPDSIEAGDEFERALYVCRRSIEKRADAEPSLDGKIFYICSMNARTIVYYAVDYLEAATRAVLAGDPENSALSAQGLDVVVIGGGDTGNDCVGTPPRRIEGSEHEIPAQLVLIACGDARTGSSLVASAIADALACAREVAEVLQF